MHVDHKEFFYLQEEVQRLKDILEHLVLRYIDPMDVAPEDQEIIDEIVKRALKDNK